MTTDNPRISICMPTYNRAACLKQTLPTVLQQKCGDFELLVQDDCSKDDTEEVVRSFRDPRIHYQRNSANRKMPGNLNEAIRRARGEYVVVFHDHDLYASTALQEMALLLDQEPSVGFVHPGILWMNPDTGQTRDLVADWPRRMAGRIVLDHLLWHWSSPICALFMARKACYEEIGLYDAAFGFISDVEMTLRLCMTHDVGYVAKPLVTCLEREKGHEYSKINWALLRMAVAMRRQCIDHLYETAPLRRSLARSRLAFRREIYLLRHLAICVRQRERPLVQEGRAVIADDCTWVTRAAAGIGVHLGKVAFR